MMAVVDHNPLREVADFVAKVKIFYPSGTFKINYRPIIQNHAGYSECKISAIISKVNANTDEGIMINPPSMDTGKQLS